MNRIAKRERKGFEEGENLTDSVGLEKQLNNVRYDWQGGENSIQLYTVLSILFSPPCQYRARTV